MSMLGVVGAQGSIHPLGPDSWSFAAPSCEGGRGVPIPAEPEGTRGSSCQLAGGAAQRSPERGFPGPGCFLREPPHYAAPLLQCVWFVM